MMDNSLISILMPCRNTESFLEECLDSIINQLESNWELIVVNDHSTDRSNIILEEYALKEERIKVYQNNGKGIIDALSLAYSKSNGELITRMDSDDIMSLNKLEVLKNNLLKEGEGHIALGLVSYFSETTLGEGFKRYEEWLNGLIRKGNNFNEIYKECVIPSPCWMVYREDLDECNAFNPNDYPEDYDLAFRFYMKGLKCIPSNQVLHYWRDYSYRTSRTDSHYADNGFLEIKITYFLKLNYQRKKKLVLWGAGKKGKTIAQKLISKKISFDWVCDNPKKIGKKIYGKELLNFHLLEEMKNFQSIVTVANKQAQKDIKKYLKVKKRTEMIDYFFFC